MKCALNQFGVFVRPHRAMSAARGMRTMNPIVHRAAWALSIMSCVEWCDDGEGEAGGKLDGSPSIPLGEAEEGLREGDTVKELDDIADADEDVDVDVGVDVDVDGLGEGSIVFVRSSWNEPASRCCSRVASGSEDGGRVTPNAHTKFSTVSLFVGTLNARIGSVSDVRFVDGDTCAMRGGSGSTTGSTCPVACLWLIVTELSSFTHRITCELSDMFCPNPIAIHPS